MAQAQLDFQNLIHLEQMRHEEEKEVEIEKLETVESILFPLQKTMSQLQNELNQDIFLNDKAIKKYNNSKVKARNFLSNVSYNRITKLDYKNENFVVDCFTFLILYLNPFYLERKFESNVEREFVNVLWLFLMPNDLYNYIHQNDNMTTLIKLKVKYPDAKKIILDFLKHDQGNLKVLSDYSEKNGILYQFLYGNLFPKCFCRVNDYGVKAKLLFNTYYQNFNVQKKVINWQNNILKEEEEEKEEKKEQKIQIKKEEEEEKYYNVSPITTLEDENVKQPKTKKKRKSINTETKEQKREEKKQKLLEQLKENTEKIKRLKNKYNK